MNNKICGILRKHLAKIEGDGKTSMKKLVSRMKSSNNGEKPVLDINIINNEGYKKDDILKKGNIKN